MRCWPILAVTITSAGVGSADPLPARWSFATNLAAGVESFQYSEYANTPGSPVVDSEHATTPIYTLAVTARSPKRWFVRGTLALADGAMHYDGATQDGSPLAGRTTGSIFNGELVAGVREHLADDRVELAEYVGFGYRRWDRDLGDLPDDAGYIEVYSQGYYLLGIDATVHAAPVDVDLDLGLAPPSLLGPLSGPFANLRITDAVFDPVTLPLAQDADLRAGVRVRYALRAGWGATAAARYETSQIDNSPTVPITLHGQPILDGCGMPVSIGEPASNMVRIQVTAGVDYTW